MPELGEIGRIPWQPPKDDEAERFYSCGDAYINKCNLCGSLGTLFHFNGWQEVCPFCVIREARKPLIEALVNINVETGMYAGDLAESRYRHVDHIHELAVAALAFNIEKGA